MPILSGRDPERPPAAIHTARGMAESFGVDAVRYDRARPAYPQELVTRILGAAGDDGSLLLDVGCGTGIAARQFAAAGCEVLGVEPDARMAAFAQATGVPVEVATFEDWDPAGRSFDLVIAAQSWHWVDPDVGLTKAGEVLRSGGLLAIFGHVFEPPGPVAEALADAMRREVPDSPFRGGPARTALEVYRSGYAAIAEAIGRTGNFDEPQQWQLDVERTYTREQWLDLLPTTGGLTRLAPEQLNAVTGAVGAAIDALGGRFTTTFSTLAVAARRAARTS